MHRRTHRSWWLVKKKERTVRQLSRAPCKQFHLAGVHACVRTRGCASVAQTRAPFLRKRLYNGRHLITRRAHTHYTRLIGRRSVHIVFRLYALLRSRERGMREWASVLLRDGSGGRRKWNFTFTRGFVWKILIYKNK